MTEEKKADVWMPLWIGAYLADTMKLTTIQHGAYLLLLIAYWRERGPLANDDDELRSITKLERSEWKRIRPVLEKFFKVADGVWWHKRVEAEIAAADKRSKQASEKAAKAAEARWGKGDKQPPSNAPSMPEALPEHVLDDCPPPSPLPLPSGDSEANASDGAAAPAVEKSPEEMAKAELWRASVSVLEQGGCPRSQCRTFMGKLVGDYDFEIVQAAVAAAVSAQPAEAREYLKATCQRLKGERAPAASPITQPSNAADRTRAELEREASREIVPPSAENLARLAAIRDAVQRRRHGHTEAGAPQEAGDLADVPS